MGLLEFSEVSWVKEFIDRRTTETTKTTFFICFWFLDEVEFLSVAIDLA